jgi:hypothetical protein
MRNADRLQVFHGRPQSPRIDVFVALELDLAHFYFRAFLDHECEADGCRRNLAYFRSDSGELPAVLRQQPFDRHFRFFYSRGVILILDRQSDLRQLKAIQHITRGDRTQADVVNLADRWLFLDVYDDPPTLRRLLPAELNVFEVTGVPKRVEIAL